MNIWQKNIQLLKLKNAELANKVRTVISTKTEILITKSNSYTAKYEGVLINSLYNPMKEAEVRVDSVEEIEKANIVISLGFGIGYEINEMLRRINKRCIILALVINLDVFRKIMETVDLSNILSFERLLVIDGTSENLKQYFAKISMPLLYFCSNVVVYKHPVIEKFNQKVIEKAQKDIVDILIYNSIAIGNAPGDTLEGLEHIFQNFENILKSYDITKLKGKFEGIPAICVASGPSLNKNIHHLKKAKGKAVIFAADTILEKLRKENIEFHAVSVLERPKFIYDKLFREKPLEKNVVLFGAPVIYPRIFKEHKGKNIVVFKSTTIAENFLSRKLDNLNELPTGFSVAHMNFAIAHYLGFSPIILIGQDLAYGKDGYSHAQGTIHERNTIKDDIQSGKVVEELYVKGINGKTVRTTRTWKQFLDWFELEIKEKQIFCIDASEDGAYIEGTQVMTLEEAIGLYCNKELAFDFNNFFEEIPKEQQKLRKNIIIEEMNYQIEELEKAENLIVDAKRYLKKFNNKVKACGNKFDINKYVDPINKNINELQYFSMFAFISQALTTDLGRKNNSMVEINTEEDCVRWYKIQMNYIRLIQGIMKLTKKLFADGKKNIEKLIEGIEVIYRYFQQGKEKEGIEIFNQFLEGLSWLEKAIDLTKDVQREPINIIDIKNELRQLEDVLTRKDFTLMSDILFYELKPLLEKWKVKLLCKV